MFLNSFFLNGKNFSDRKSKKINEETIIFTNIKFYAFKSETV